LLICFPRFAGVSWVPCRQRSGVHLSGWNLLMRGLVLVTLRLAGRRSLGGDGLSCLLAEKGHGRLPACMGVGMITG